jgi:hypothetical protein
MLAVAATPAVTGCGGVVDNNGDGGTGGIDSGLPGCNAEWIDGGLVCGAKEAQLSGDLSKCNLTSDSGGVPPTTCQAICAQQYCSFNSNSSVLTCGGVCIGRLPSGVTVNPTAPQDVGDYLARVAFLEAAAVDAFGILAHELDAHGAPGSLRRAIERAATDEVRHASEMERLAGAYGARVEVPTVTKRAVRPLFDIALENAVEGCVRETFGALVAAWQSEHAEDTDIRGAMQRIAGDEARHAALGWRIFEWTNDMLSVPERARVMDAMMGAVRELEAGARVEPDRTIAATLGLPSAVRATALVRAMRSELWS